MKPFIHPSFWSDPEIEQQPSDIKLCALWLITNSQTSVIGICEASPRRFVFETGLKATVLDRVCEALPGTFTRFGSSILIRNFIRHQFGTGEALTKNNYFKAMVRTYRSVRENDVRKAVLAEYPEFESAEEGLSKGLPSPTQGVLDPKEGIGREGKGKEGGSAEGGESEPPGTFQQFWDAYPRKEDKGKARKAWKTHNCAPLVDLILATVERYKKTDQWQKDAGQFIPHPTTWLNGKRWEDEPAASGPTSEIAYWESPHPDAKRPQDELLREAFQKNWGDNPAAAGILAKIGAMENGGPAPL